MRTHVLAIVRSKAQGLQGLIWDPKTMCTGVLRLWRSAWHSKNWQKLHWFSVLYFNRREFGWLKPPKLPPSGDGTEYC